MIMHTSTQDATKHNYAQSNTRHNKAQSCAKHNNTRCNKTWLCANTTTSDVAKHDWIRTQQHKTQQNMIMHKIHHQTIENIKP